MGIEAVRARAKLLASKVRDRVAEKKRPGTLSNGKSPACVSPVPGRLPDKHPVGRLENAALHASPIAKSPREGQRLSKKRLRESSGTALRLMLLMFDMQCDGIQL
ncbi:hypothetical protein HPB48_017939 [Haemaphysalis longicornis]|uniref:Uncharacterized protein n=1 Tax=Haemaphysalis longicornis TaxID=44386 RepID=A0A9J6GJG1_HAELO|nr:hypothetical protein HPB48_017939 [Haemaphysalis longicornis]